MSEKQFLLDTIEQAKTDLSKAKNAQIPRWAKDSYDIKGTASKKYQGIIYIVMDKETGSTAEEMIEWLDLKLHAVKPENHS